MVFTFLVLLCACGCVFAIDTGFPAGYMGDCPGMYNDTQFSDSTKRSLSVVVMWPTNGFIRSQERKCQLSVRGAACVARHLNLNKRKTQVMITGYLDATFSPVVRSVAAPYLEMGRNIILVEVFPLLIRPYPIHIRSAFYWLLAYENPDKFIAVRCESVAKARHGDCYNDTVVPNFLGPKTNFTNKGIYYLPTKEQLPYYIGEEGLKKRKYNHNGYLLRVSPDNDVIV
ncbi:hypothetical protein MSG28_001452 [Choristoneura fumiferana]|uniref:Uncharacterized protein n=1 Tax=Choristoneura fumiferana TaxID=7141 RepID=A0ACC0KUP4_CHOFU|nr:hypothetical protein MSG28_001452 [Choristoneura fumiferana]